MESTSKVSLSLQTLSEITAATLGFAAVDATELADGWFNTIYRITLEGGRSAVIKMAPPATFVAMRYEKHLMQSEVEVLRVLKSVDGVVVPSVLAYEHGGTIHDHDFFLMDFVPGASYSKIRAGLPAATRGSIDRELGEISSRVNAITGGSFGRYHEDHCTAATWPDALVAMVDDLLLDAVDMGADLPVDAATIRRAYLGAASELGEVTTPQLVLWDLHPGNVFVNDDKVSGIIDCDRALWGDPLMEFFFRSIWDSTPEFHEGYLEERVLLDRPGSGRCLWLYDLYLALVMLVECWFRGFDEAHTEWARKEFGRVVDLAKPGWL